MLRLQGIFSTCESNHPRQRVDAVSGFLGTLDAEITFLTNNKKKDKKNELFLLTERAEKNFAPSALFS